MTAAIRINLSPDEAARLLAELEHETGIPRELFEDLAETFIEEYEKVPRGDVA